MKPNEVKLTIYRKDEKGKYQYDAQDKVELNVMKGLCEMLIAKKLNKCTYITKITKENLYNGFYRIKVYTPYKYMFEYIVKEI